MRLKNKLLCALILFSSSCIADWKVEPSAFLIYSDPVYQEAKTGGTAKAIFMMEKGSISYMVSSNATKNICRMHPDLMTHLPILIEDVEVPAASWCAGDSVFTSVRGDAARWLFNKLWAQRYVVIDGWKVDATGFQKATRQLNK